MSFIYKDLDLDQNSLEMLGYFPTKKEFHTLDPNKLFQYHLGNFKEITSETVIVYFPGAFSLFHYGHSDLITTCYAELRETYDDVRIIISPANSDYLFDKYGSSTDVTNISRFNRILKALSGINISKELFNSISIDLDPMLNTVCDFNFPDLLNNYISKIGFTFNTIQKPYILLGKDRSSYKDIQEYTDLFNCYYFIGDSDVSSKDFKDNMGKFIRKEVLVRVYDTQEFNIFKKHMFPFYNKFKMSLISDECKKVEEYLSVTNSSSNNIYTNCKDYESDTLNYVSIKRVFKHPLDKYPTIHCDTTINKDDIFLDSDSFSGATQDYIESFNAKLIPLYNYRYFNTTQEIVDIEDIYKPEFNYPNFDISERLGIQIFTTEMHSIFNDLKQELQDYKNGQ